MALHAWYHQQDTDELPTYHRLVLVCPLYETLLCGVPCLILPWDKRRERGENHVAEDLDGAFLRLCLFLSQLVAVGIAHRKNWCSFALYLDAVFGLYLPADGMCMDERLLKNNLMDDVFNTENESFM